MDKEDHSIVRDEIKRAIARCILDDYIGVVDSSPRELDQFTLEKIKSRSYTSNICAQIFSKRNNVSEQQFQEAFSTIARENGLTQNLRVTMSDEKFYELAGNRVLQQAKQLGLLQQSDSGITYTGGLEKRI